MRQNGCIPREYKEILNFRRNMKKNKMRHYETLQRGLFTRMIPHPIFSGETNMKIRAGQNSEPLLEHDPEPKQPTLDEIWEWLGNPDKY